VGMATSNGVIVLKCHKISPTGNWRNRTLFIGPNKNKNSTPCQTVTTAWIAPKICQGQPPTFGSHHSRFYLNRFTFGGVITERTKAVLFMIGSSSYYHSPEAKHGFGRIMDSIIRHPNVLSDSGNNGAGDANTVYCYTAQRPDLNTIAEIRGKCRCWLSNVC